VVGAKHREIEGGEGRRLGVGVNGAFLEGKLGLEASYVGVGEGSHLRWSNGMIIIIRIRRGWLCVSRRRCLHR